MPEYVAALLLKVRLPARTQDEAEWQLSLLVDALERMGAEVTIDGFDRASEDGRLEWR
jgi:hypothetical protein